MKRNKIVIAVSIAVNSGVLFSAMPQAHAGDLVAMNVQPESTKLISSRILKARSEETGEELLARGLARLAAAKQPQDFQTAYHFFEVAANKGNAEAQFQLAIMQLDNQYVNGNEESAIHWLEEAILQGHAQAAVALDVVLSAGDTIGC